MKILALETSSSCVSVGLCLDSGMIFEESLLNRGSQFILGAVDKLLKDARIKLDDVDVFGISIGPGSFTGLRVGLSFAKGFSYSCRRPLVVVESLKVWASPLCRKSTNIVVLLDAKRTCVYGQAFLCQNGVPKAIHEPFMGPVKDFLAQVPRESVFVGSACGLYEKEIRDMFSDSERIFVEKQNTPKAKDLIALVLHDAKNKKIEFNPEACVAPIYFWQP